MEDDEGLAGRTLAGRYDLVALLGLGGMGAVYRARDRELDEEIALKVIRGELARDPAALERFRREVKLARRVTHRNVARTFELAHGDDLVFCTMELVEGESLRDRLRREHRLAVPQAVAIARELCEGLAAAHAAGVIHRDIKPDNVLIARDGRVVLADFGVAAAVAAASSEIAGTLAYMAPEQARGEAPTPASDIYAVGVLLYEMVTGRRAFHGRTDDVRAAKQEIPQLVAEGVGHDLAALIARVTARDPGDRLASAHELGRLLGELGQAAPSAPPVAHHGDDELHTVVVLPPRAEGERHLALGVHEQLLARLGRLPCVRVLPRTSATAEPADSIVELVAGDALVATITRSAGAPLVLRLPLAVGELHAAADTIAGAVATIVEQRATRLPPAAAGALDLVLRVRELLQRNFSAIGEVRAMLERAHALAPGDPRIAAAAATLEVREVFLAEEASPERLERARAFVEAALAAGPELPEAHVAAGQLELSCGEPWRAARHFREAIALAPYIAEAHEHLGRLLLEAGYLDLGLARLEDALAIAPRLASARWEIARAWALEGQWEQADQLIAALVASGLDRPLARARLAWWRGELDTLAEISAVAYAAPDARTPFRLRPVIEILLQRSWPGGRAELFAVATAPRSSRRRTALAAQITAEIAGYFDDGPACLELTELAAAAGLYDLHWLDRCPVLDAARREPGFAALRERIERRAAAILDAMFGDPVTKNLSETVVG